MPDPKNVRLYAILARDSSRAVLFRRGPSKQVLLVNWDTATDTIEEGQWFKGRIYERRCDLSPCGEFLLYFAASQRRPHYSWTAISRPPYFTALALWPKGDAWGGGGHFASRDHILLNHWGNQMQPAEDFSVPNWLRVEPFGDRSGRGEDNPIWAERLSRDGWVRVSEGKTTERAGADVWIDFDPPVIWEKPHPNWPERYALRMKILGLKEKGGPWYVCDHDVADATSGEVYAFARTDWADWSHSGDLVFTKHGAIHRVICGPSALADLHQPALVADLCDRTFTARKAPSDAARWPKR